MADEIHRLILTASVLFYFLYHSQKATFPVDIHAIETLVAKARAELEGVRIGILLFFFRMRINAFVCRIVFVER